MITECKAHLSSYVTLHSRGLANNSSSFSSSPGLYAQGNGSGYSERAKCIYLNKDHQSVFQHVANLLLPITVLSLSASDMARNHLTIQ